MKKIFTCLSLILICVFCGTSCQRMHRYSSLESVGDRPENIQMTNNDSAVYLYGDAIYYKSDGFYNMRLFRSDEKGTKRLLSESDLPDQQKIENFRVYKDQLYVLAVRQAETSFFYQVFSDGTYQEICRVPGRIFQWTIYGDDLFYGKYAGDTDLFEDIYRFGLSSGKEYPIASAARKFSLENGAILYATGTYDYKISAYDIATSAQTALCAFSYEKEVDFLAISSQGIAVCSTDELDTLLIYRPGEQKLHKISLPKEIQQSAPGQNCLFVTLYNCNENGSDPQPSEQNGLYRIHLKTEKIEQLSTELEKVYSMFVVSDDCVYAEQSAGRIKNRSEIYRVDAALKKAEPICKL